MIAEITCEFVLWVHGDVSEHPCSRCLPCRLPLPPIAPAHISLGFQFTSTRGRAVPPRGALQPPAGAGGKK